MLYKEWIIINNDKLGNLGENIAIKYLLENDYSIIARNFRCKQGEIDIIAKDKNEWVFIEVKTRSNLNYGRPLDAVDEYKKKHIYNGAKYFVYVKGLENEYIRFDVIEVYLTKEKAKINHIKSINIK